MSTGLLSKRNRNRQDSVEFAHFAPPDTPCKRSTQAQFAVPSSSLKTVARERPTSMDGDEMFDPTGSTSEYEMPPTPTKAFGSGLGGDSTRNAISNWAVSTKSFVSDSQPTMSPTQSFFELETPSTPAKFNSSYFDPSLTPSGALDPFLLQKFQDVSAIGSGEFSTVFLVSERDQLHNKYAVKRTKTSLVSTKALSRRLEEVAILRDLSSRTDNEDRDYVLHFIDSWNYEGHLYIMTEYCENGSLDVFLAEYGRISKLDEWRVWKILIEIALGIRFIHESGYIHLDLKPANVLITFEGSLKIGDFGMATKLPATKGIEREGDREYIAPEVLALQEYSKPADIFSFGLILLEIAANIVLPDNGTPWHKLRSGDLSDAGRLSSSSGDLSTAGNRVDGAKIPSWAPEFMTDDESDVLGRLVTWMLKPSPNDRPTVQEILSQPEVVLADSRRKAGAIIFEGEYGPEPDDSEMEISDKGQDNNDDWRMDM
ncbi:kinase-like domain-containing protein [Limtongia smithiae]|uniref:kinase-like domain-containing protein n=1 Tax=Limtongia smithiae TaxID=1125753 RepID=UPI0034CD4FD3